MKRTRYGQFYNNCMKSKLPVQSICLYYEPAFNFKRQIKIFFSIWETKLFLVQTIPSFVNILLLLLLSFIVHILENY